VDKLPIEIQPMFTNDIKAIFFDLDGTLRHSDPSSMETFYRFAAEAGFVTTPQQQLLGERWVNVYWAESQELQQDLARFGPWHDNGEFWINHARRHLVSLGSPGEQAEILSKQVSMRMRAEYEPVDCVKPEVPHMLERLRGAGFALAVVSNRSQPYDELMHTLDLAQYFDFWVAAGEVGAFKPDPAVLHHAAERAGVGAGQTVYVGDNYYADVCAALAAGMHPVLYDSKGLYPEVNCVVIRDITHLEPLLLTCSDNER
jgi:HAD superfamily hydrolase (TIGR01509 family)